MNIKGGEMKKIRIQKRDGACEENQRQENNLVEEEQLISMESVRGRLVDIIRNQVSVIGTRQFDGFREEFNDFVNLHNTLENKSFESSSKANSAIFVSFQRLLAKIISCLTSRKKQEQQQQQGDIIIRVKSEQRMKLKIEKDLLNQIKSYQTYDTNQIFQLKDKNKRMERKILLISQEFRNLRNKYESQIQKYKGLLNNLQSQIHSFSGGSKRSENLGSPRNNPSAYFQREESPRFNFNLETKNNMVPSMISLESKSELRKYLSNQELRNYK